MRMNQPDGKRLLAQVRGGDYAKSYYRSLLQAIDEGVLGGVIVCATRRPDF